jgi:hypothetical protein
VPNTSKSYAQVARDFIHCSTNKTRRGRPPKLNWEMELARIVDYIIMGEILKRPKRKASQTIRGGPGFRDRMAVWLR